MNEQDSRVTQSENAETMSNREEDLTDLDVIAHILGGSPDDEVAELPPPDDESQSQQQPVENGEPPTQQKTMRHRMVVLCGVAAAMLVISVGWLQAELARRHANARAARAVEASGVANQRLALATEAVAEILEEVGDETVKNVPQMESVRTTLLDKAIPIYEEISKTSELQNERSRFATAMAHFQLGDIRRLLGKQEDREIAKTQYLQAIDGLYSLSSEFPTNRRYRQQLARGYMWLGELFRIQLNPQPAEENYARAIALQTDLVSESNDDERVHYSIDLARSHMNRGISRKNQARLKGALEDYDAVVWMLEEVVEHDLDPEQDEECRVLLANCYNNQGMALQIADSSLPVRAKAAFVDAIDELVFVANRRPSRRLKYGLDLARFHDNLAKLELEDGNLDDAAKHNAEAVRLCEQLSAGTPAVRLQAAKYFLSRASILDRQNQTDEAVVEFDNASNIVESVRSQNEDDANATDLLGLILLNKCRFYQQHERHEEAINSVKSLIDVPRKSLFLIAIDLMKKGIDSVDEPTLIKEYHFQLDIFERAISGLD